MKSILKQIAFFGALSTVLASCDNEIEATAPYKDLSAVYATIDINEDTNYIRIGRLYLGDQGFPGGSQEPDSLYYTGLTASVNELDATGNIVRTFVLEESTDITLDSGFFSTDGYKVYRLIGTLNQNYSYQLVIDRPSSDVTAVTPLVNVFNMTDPKSLALGSTAGEEFKWSSAKNGKGYQLQLEMKYLEMPVGNQSDSTIHYAYYTFPYQVSTSSTITTRMSKPQFQAWMVGAMQPKPGYLRFVRKFKATVTAGAEELDTYLSASQGSNGVLQDPPSYTNVTNGVGIFSSVTTQGYDNLQLAPQSLDTLVYSDPTCSLRFAKAQAGDTLYCQ